MKERSFTVCGIPYEEYQKMKYQLLKERLESAKPLKEDKK